MTDRICSVEGCERPHSARGLCNTHYCRLTRNGDLGGPIPDPIRVCTIDGCDRPHMARGLCKPHYERNRRSGSPGKATIEKPRINKPPRQPCSIPWCDSLSDSRGWCNKHYLRWLFHGNPLTTKFATGTDHGRWTDRPTYRAAHNRVIRRRGPAKFYACQHCDGQAKQWAYDHLDPNEQIAADTGLTISPDPAHYFPLCNSCHVRFDMAYRQRKEPHDGDRHLPNASEHST